MLRNIGIIIIATVAMSVSACAFAPTENAAQDDVQGDSLGSVESWRLEKPETGTAGSDGDRLSGLLGPVALGLCIRTPLGPGKVTWKNNPNSSEWRSAAENGGTWVGARSGTQDTDGIHRNGWGCTVFKVPDYCTLTVNLNNTLSCCCNAAVARADGGCRWVQHAEIGASPPPGC